ncbi:rho GTPase-activating protein gacJ-like [Palaemon carinicauda]|uniref:rho GTPase-activating protein gacJ-like n=1 Tax=Palaemon carinicauda TaxID=392227 RepID=UPI0035B592A2
MKVRWQWIIGVVGLVIVGRATGQDDSTKSVPEKTEGSPANTNTTETSTKPPLTGNPQIDYIHDPNLPHELRGYNLSDYPFYPRLPEDLLLPSFNFSCDNRHDGFYASVPHKCQVYHNCLFGQRYDFLCANYTVFDQKNFICHYVSEVDCANSAKHYDRNDELYETTSTTTTTVAPPQIIYVERPRPLGGPGVIRPKRPRPFGGNNRRQSNRRTTTPAPSYYDDYEYDYYYQDYDDYYNDYTNDRTTTTTTTTQRPRRPNNPQRTRLGGQGGVRQSERAGNVFSIKDRKRPRINRPVPLDAEPSFQDSRSSRLQEASSPNQATDNVSVNGPEDGPRRGRPGRKPRPGSRPPKKTTTTTTTTESVPDEYYDEYYYDYADETTTTTTEAPRRPARPGSRTRPGGSQRRPQNRPSPIATTTTEAPTTTTNAPTGIESRGRQTRPGRVNIRRSPLNSGTQPGEEFEPSEPLPIQETTESARPRPSRLRPQTPRNRSGSRVQDEEIVQEEEEPSQDGASPVVVPTDTDATKTRINRPGISQSPIRRLGQSGSGRLRSSQQGREQVRQPDTDYDYDY